MSRPQFTLRALLVAMLVVAVPLAVWNYAPMVVLRTLAFGVLSSVGIGIVLVLAACEDFFRPRHKDG